jgi:transposase
VDVAGRELDPAKYWRTRPIPAGRSALTCDDGASPPPCPSRRISRPIGNVGAAWAGDHAFDLESHKQRNIVERAVNKLKGHRAVAARYDKRDYTFRGTVDVASIRIWLRDPVP